LSIVLIDLVTVVSGTLEVFFDIAELACLPQVVTKEQLPEALGRTQATAFLEEGSPGHGCYKNREMYVIIVLFLFSFL
ncbi:MAG TPA: hypothetical protein VFU49_11655, partial [Ktedonobacteraceae bacterium]|nr:hypothetical protein [Ktedonobacteraceae bacterium]